MSWWRPGEVVRDARTLVIPEDAPPGAYLVVVGMYAYPDQAVAITGKAESRFQLTLGWVVVSSQAIVEPQHPRQANLGGLIELLGYDLEGMPRPGGTISVTLYWRALRPLDADYTVFVQLYQPGSRPWAQEDAEPRRGNYPTSLWLAGEVVRDEHRLSLPSEAPWGDYLLLAGLYRTDNHEPLLVPDTGERHVILDRIGVGPR